ncbi:ras-related protein raba1f-like [Stylonychia lemnae]|uniref:Ras-related protein raba1f-like n=1 Tax=Stylonychia lemnae TaxID=5949 RepID=A0A078AR97_STYLE|nr:ras-related protein raba1f-like [Stylonychia lemnae]|eukprot:CDW84496.1 ras-related protein raba1f-like [Stylonychia lemnae]
MEETPQDGENYDYLFKIVLIGDSWVGKSNLLLRYTKNQFKLNYQSTIGVEFATTNIKIEDCYVKAQIWDTAGQERYRAITNAYYRNAVGALIVYDISKQNSFENVQKWHQELRDHADPNIAVMLIGNKADLKHMRAVKFEDAQNFAQNNCILVIILTVLQQQTAFMGLINEIHRLTMAGKFDYGFMGGGLSNNQSTDQQDDDNQSRRGTQKNQRRGKRRQTNKNQNIKLEPQPGLTDPKSKDINNISGCCGGQTQ